MDREKLIDELCAAWPSPLVARNKAPEFLGGGIAVGTLANKDSLGVGPKEKFYVNGRIVYDKRSLAEWFVGMAEPCDPRVQA